MTMTINLKAVRRHLHQIPELALQEYQTHDYILKVIQNILTPFITVTQPAVLPTALLVHVKGRNPQRTIGYRTDMDALPVDEKTDLTFSSQHPHVMHACGHDIHMTVALGVLDYFAQHQPKDNLIFFFQPAEESESGAKKAVDQHLFETPYQIDEFYGLHDTPELPAGTIGCRYPTLFAGTSEVDIELIGQSGHAAYPHQANDMIVAASELVVQLQTIVSRNVDPIQGAVLTIGKINGGNIRNVIAGKVNLQGTIRGLNQEMIEIVKQRILQICHGIELGFNCQVKVHINQGGYYPVNNDKKLTSRFIHFMKKNPKIKFQETLPAMTGEDFGYVLNHYPGTMFWLGVGATSALHTDTFNPNEEALIKGVQAITQFLEFRMKEDD
jgi:N-acetyldiaminopimelate deacetylase